LRMVGYFFTPGKYIFYMVFLFGHR
jgi:hypothetical protein